MSTADRIVTEFVHPPIPTRKHDWSAMRDSYDVGDPIGYGRSESDAVADLLVQEAERAEV
jgi:hypothetical protein